jgi:hypothetical protein
MFATFILVLFYRYDRVTASLWIRYPVILLGEGLLLASVCLQIILWQRNTNTSSSGIIPRWRYLVIDLHQSISGLGSPTTATISFVCPGSGVLGLTEALGQAPSITLGSCLPGGVPGAETSVPLMGEVLGVIAGVSSSSRMEGLK